MILTRPLSQAVFQPAKMGKVTLGKGDHLMAGLNCFEPGQEHAAHTHSGQDKLYVVLEGEGEAAVGGETCRISAGAVALAPSGVEHSMRNPGPGRLVVLVVFSPPPK